LIPGFGSGTGWIEGVFIIYFFDLSFFNKISAPEILSTSENTAGLLKPGFMLH
jgi:hypothetical protein